MLSFFLLNHKIHERLSGRDVFILQKSSLKVTFEFNDSNIFIIKKTSDNLGTFFIFISLSDNNDAANMGRDEFLDPLIFIFPSIFFDPQLKFYPF